MNQKFVTIKGVKYDASTGLPVGKSADIKKTSPIHAVHSIAQKTQTLKNRAASAAVSSIKAPIRKIGRNMDIARSKNISHFSRPEVSAVKRVVSNKTEKIQKHPLTARVEKKQITQKKINKPVNTVKSSKQIKEEAIADALSRPNENSSNSKGIFKKRLKLPYVIALGIILFAIAGYFTYANMPALSVRVAGAQAGINARFPDYHPDGYSPSGPVTYSDGEVNIKFKSNTGNGEFTIKQSKSSWDSSAVKNKVNKESKGEFITTEEHGLMIYTHSGNASWVNGGILYSISGNAPISNDQIIKIATSL